MSNGISALLKKYGEEVGKVKEQPIDWNSILEQRRQASQFPMLDTPQLFSAEEVAGLGLVSSGGEPFTIEEGWQLKVTPGTNGTEPSFSLVNPSGWEILSDQSVISPEGKAFTPEQAMRLTEFAPEVAQAFPQYEAPTYLTPEQETELAQILPELETYEEEDWEKLYATLSEEGKTPENITLLTLLGASSNEIDAFFAGEPAEGEVGDVTEVAWDNMEEAWESAPWILLPWSEEGKSRWHELEEAGEVSGFPGLMDVMKWLAPTKVGAAVGVAGAYIDKYIGRPWEVLVMEFSERLATIGWGKKTVFPTTPENYEVINRLDELFGEYGISAFFAEEVNDIWEYRKETLDPMGQFAMSAIEWLNPAYWVPVGATLGYAAKFTSKIPVIGQSIKGTAAGVQAIERGIVYPVAKPIELGAHGIEALSKRLGQATVDRLIKESSHLVSLEDLVKMTDKEILDGMLVDNWMSRVLKAAAKIPPVKKFITSTLGWRILVRRGSTAVEDIVGRGAVLVSYFERMGINAQGPIIQSLRSVLKDPVKYFGLDRGFSKSMTRRALPAFAKEKNIGTLEHILTHPEMYNWSGWGKTITLAGGEKVNAGLAYVSRIGEINRALTALLEKEGILPEHIVEDWVHRVVQSEGKAARRGGRAIGAKQPYEKARKFETMADGIAWFNKHPELGAYYASNPEIAVAEYAQQVLRNVGHERFVKYLAQFEEVAGLTPSTKLLEQFPELAQRAILTAEELKATKYFSDAINRAIRGERLPTATLKAIERRFPELGQRFRALIQEPAAAERALRDILAQNEKVINRLTAQLKKAEAIDIEAIKAEAVAEARVQIPPEAKLREAFSVMDYEDRLAFRSTMQGQLDDVGRVSADESNQLAGLQEALSLDPVANATFRLGGRNVDLTAFISIREQSFPEYFSVKQAEALFPRGNFSRFTEKGTKLFNRVPRDVALDDLTKKFGMSADEIADRVMQIRADRQTIQDLKLLVGMETERFNNIERMLKILDEVETKPKYIPRPEPGMPEAGVQKDLFGYETPYFPKGKGEVTQISMEEYAKLVELHEKAGLPPPDIAIKPKIEGITGLGETEIGIGEQQISDLGSSWWRKRIERYRGLTVNEGIIKARKRLSELEKISVKSPGDEEAIAIYNTELDELLRLRGAPQVKKVRFELPPPKTAAERLEALKALKDEIGQLSEARRTPFWQAKAERAFRMEQLRQPGLGEGYVRAPFAGGKIYDQEFIDAFNRFFGHQAGIPGLTVIADTAGILRITKAALDFSIMAIQGLPSFGLAHSYMLINPPVGLRLMGSWYKAFFESIGIFFDRDILARAIDKKFATVSQRISFGGSSRAIDYFSILERRSGFGGLAEKAMKKIPLSPYERAEASFYGAGEIIRNDFWEILGPKAIKNGRGFELARSLDLMTGIADSAAMGVPLTTRQLEQAFVWFAPNYTRACLTVLADIFRGSMTGSMARRALGGMISAGAIYYSAVQFGASILAGKTPEQAWEDVRAGFCIEEDPITGEVTWDPSARFMTLKIGNYNFGFGGFWYGLVRLGGNIMDCVNEVGDREIIDLVRIIKDGSLNKQDNPFIYWWFSRASPFVGTGFELATGKNFLGYPIEGVEEYAKYIATRFEPIWMEQGLNWLIPGMAKANEIPEGAARAAVAPAELFGLRTFPDSAWVKFYDQAAEYIKQIPQEEFDPNQIDAWRKGKLGWGQLTQIQKLNLLSRYPDLNDLYETAQADSAVRDSSNWQAWESRMDEERTIYYQRIDELTQRLISGEIDTREYRELAGEAGQNYGYALESIERDPAYEEIYNYFDTKESTGEKYGFLDDIMLNEYLTTIAYAEDLTKANGDYDWDERDRRIDAFIEKWGEDEYQRVLDYIAEKKGLTDLSPVWIKKSQDTEALGRGYWRLPYKPIIEMDADDEAEGSIPIEYLDLWRQYQALETDEDKEALIEAHHELAKDWRAEFRQQNPEADAMLALWGYGGKLQTMEAYNLVVKWGKEFGIPLSQMGLGLPPQSLVNEYFGYNQITSAMERKWYRQENPDFDEWGVENYGWTPISEQSVMPRNIYNQYQEYLATETGKARLVFRHEHPELEQWLVEEKGYTPVGDRWQ